MRFGLRSLLKHPGHTAVVVLTLALGIGANTAIFSVIHAVMIRPLPYENPDQLVLLRHRIEATDFIDGPLPPADVMDIRDHTDVFQGVAATDRTFEQNLTGDGDPIEVRCCLPAGAWIFCWLCVRRIYLGWKRLWAAPSCRKMKSPSHRAHSPRARRAP